MNQAPGVGAGQIMDSSSAKPRVSLLGSPGNADRAGRDRGEGAREGFCQFLRAERERASLTIEEIARVTRIPEHSLRRLEAGEFEDLPADVFVRGFLRSYARCVGVDADEVVRRYEACGGLAPAPVASELARVAAEQAAAVAEQEDREEVSAPLSMSETGAALVGAAAAREPDSEARLVSRPARESSSRLPKVETGRWSMRLRRDRARAREQVAQGAPAARATKRPGTAAARRRPAGRPRTVSRVPIALGVAVVILLIAAVLIMSHLLRRPREIEPEAGATGCARSGSLPSA